MADSKDSKGAGSGKEGPDLNRILARAATAKTSEYGRGIYPAGALGTAGVIPLRLEGRFAKERSRLTGEFTEVDRQWRIKWHRDKVLHPDEPVRDAELKMERELLNPLRRFYRRPLDWLERTLLAPKIGTESAWLVRKMTSTLFMTYVVTLFLYYNLKYNHSSWERTFGVKVSVSRPPLLPGDDRFPVLPRPNKEDYYDQGFKKRKVFID